MTPTFNLITEPWVPCILAGDAAGVVADLGIRDTLLRAHDLKGIYDPSPLVTAALHRLLLAILHRNFGPADAREWKTLWDKGAFPAKPLKDYFKEWEGRFDLFDVKRPFYQDPRLKDDEPRPINNLIHELAAGHNPTLFDHSVEGSVPPLSFGLAARLVVARQSFAVGGLITRAGGGSVDAAKQSPLMKAVVFVIQGENLFETLMLNLIHYNLPDSSPCPGDMDKDKPAWEQNLRSEPKARKPYGYVDYLTWQNRRILLKVSSEGGEVAELVLVRGDELDEVVPVNQYETMCAFRKIFKAKAGAPPVVPVGFNEDRALWRDSVALLETLNVKDPSEERLYECPKTLHWLADLASKEYIEVKKRYSVAGLGLCADRAKLIFWRGERFPLPGAYLDPEYGKRRVDELRKGLTLAEAVSRQLKYNLNHLAELLLAPAADNAEGRRPLKEDVTELSASFGADRIYWSRLEEPFFRLLQDIPAPRRKTEPEPLVAWAAKLKKVAEDGFDELAEGIGDSARALKAVAIVGKRFHNELWFGVKDKKGDVVWAGLKLYLGKPEETKEVTNAKE
jgi:CRISPR system Cascade subunit CasA